jgi:Co/Zn/Cd efflux system component
MKQRLKAGRQGDPVTASSLTSPAAPCACHPSAQELAATPDVTRRRRNLRILGWILILNIVTMVAEVATGLFAQSVSLAADGWHTLGHTVALGLTYFVMRYLLRVRMETPQIETQSALAPAPPKLARIERATGLANAGLLVLMGAYTVYDAIVKFVHPHPQDFRLALGVACVGLVVNLTGGYLLHDSHDHGNVAERGMYLHVLSDALMSVLAIAALCAGLYANLPWADPLVGILGGLVILKWGAALFVQGWLRSGGA